MNDALSWRPIEPADAPAWATLLAAIQLVDNGWEYFSEQDLRADFGDPDRDFVRGSIAAFAGPAMVGYGVLAVRAGSDSTHDMRYEGGVAPDYRAMGLGSRLLAWAEAAAVPLHRERFGGRPLSLSGSCLSRDTSAIALYAAHGYQPARWFHGMVRDLLLPLPDAQPPAGVDIVGLTSDRAEDARSVRNDAFRDHWGSTETNAESWAHFMDSTAFRPALSYLADVDGEAQGFLIGQEYDAYTEATGIRELHIPLIGTRRAGRHRGIASALIGRALASARAAGYTAASLGVDVDSLTGALALYERAGFVVENTTVTQTKQLLAAS